MYIYINICIFLSARAVRGYQCSQKGKVQFSLFIFRRLRCAQLLLAQQQEKKLIYIYIYYYIYMCLYMSIFFVRLWLLNFSSVFVGVKLFVPLFFSCRLCPLHSFYYLPSGLFVAYFCWLAAYVHFSLTYICVRVFVFLLLIFIIFFPRHCWYLFA